MDVKRLVIISCAIFVVACSATQVKPTQEELLFKNIALAICMGNPVESDKQKTDFNRAAMGYFERSHLSPESLDQIRALSDEWLSKFYVSKHGGEINSAKCIDMFSSQELQQLYEKESPCRAPESWLDKNDYEKSCNEHF